jgi:hypothetical protein
VPRLLTSPSPSQFFAKLLLQTEPSEHHLKSLLSPVPPKPFMRMKLPLPLQQQHWLQASVASASAGGSQRSCVVLVCALCDMLMITVLLTMIAIFCLPFPSLLSCTLLSPCQSPPLPMLRSRRQVSHSPAMSLQQLQVVYSEFPNLSKSLMDSSLPLPISIRVLHQRKVSRLVSWNFSSNTR